MNPGHSTHAARWSQIKDAFETLTPSSLDHLVTLYAPAASFKDPFNEVVGRDAIRSIFRKMFDALDAPHFVVTQSVIENRHAVLMWEFRFRFRQFDRKQEQVIRGASHIQLDDAGLMCVHRDYWDAAEELYEKIPLIKYLARWLRWKMH